MKNELTAKRLRTALSNANMKPQELADRSGVSKASISQYVNGSHAPGNISAKKIGKVLEVEPMWLMGFDVPMNRENAPTEKSNPNTALALTPRDERDIKRDLDNIMDKLAQKEYGPAAYDGEELSPEAAELFRDELEIALKRLKLINKEKYNPHKNGK